MTADFAGQKVDLAKEADFRLGGILVRPATRQVESAGAPETLEPRIMQVLVALARRRGEVVSRDELIATCWEGRIVGDDALNRCIARIRKLGEAKADFRLETIPRVGYRLWEKEAPGAVAAPAIPAGVSARKKPIWLGPPVLVSALVILAVLATAIYLGIRNSMTVEVAAPPIVAVLPFDALGDNSLQPFARSLADEVTSVMSRHQLRVSPPSNYADMSRKEQVAETERIGAALMLDGVVQKDGGDLRVSVHLTDADAGLTVWSKEFRRSAGQSTAFAYQVSSHAVDILRCALISRRPKSGDIPPQTLTIFLNACDRVQRFENPGGDMYEAARQVTKSAPEFSFGWSMLAMVVAQSIGDPAAPDAEAKGQQAKFAAEQALKLDPANGEAYVALALLVPPNRWQERLDLLDKAMRLQPDLSDAYAWKAGVLMDVGRMKEAISLYQRAVEMDGLAPNHWADLVRALSANNRHAEAKVLREKLYNDWPDSFAVTSIRITNAIYASDPAEGLRVMQEIPDYLRSPFTEVWAQYLRARVSGRPADRKAAADAMGTLARRDPNLIGGAILMNNALGNMDEVFALTDMYLSRVKYPNMWSLFFPPNAPMRADPRIISVFDRLGLLDYWRTSGNWPDFCEAEPAAETVCRQMKGG